MEDITSTTTATHVQQTEEQGEKDRRGKTKFRLRSPPPLPKTSAPSASTSSSTQSSRPQQQYHQYDLSSFSRPGLPDSGQGTRFYHALEQWADDLGVDSDQLIDKVCLFYSIHGTSPYLDASHYIILTSGEMQIYVTHGEISQRLLSDSNLTMRSIMRSFADRTRTLLTRNAHIRPIFSRIMVGTRVRIPRHLAFDFADGCVNPPLDDHLLKQLNTCKQLCLSDQQHQL